MFPRVAKLNQRGEYEVVFEPEAWVAPDPFMTTHGLDLGLADPQISSG